MNKFINYKINLLVGLALRSYFINVFIANFSNSQYIVSLENSNEYIKTIKIFTYIFPVFLLLFFYKFNKKYIIIDIFISICFFISFFISKLDIIIFIYFLLFRYIPFSGITKTYFIATLMSCLCVYITYLFDLYPESYLSLYRAGEDFYRSPMGFRFPTYFPNVLFSIFLCWAFLRKENIKLLELSIMLFLAYIVYLQTDTRTVVYFTGLLIISLFFLKIFKINMRTVFIGKIFSFFCLYGFILFGIVSIYLQYIYSPDVEWLALINEKLSGRLYYGFIGLENYTPNLWGHKIEYITMLEATNERPFFGIDSGFLKLFLDHGIIIFLLISLAFFIIGKYISKRNEPYIGVVFILFIAQMTINPYLSILDFNVFFFMISYFMCEYRENLFK